MKRSNRWTPDRLLYVDDNPDDVLFFQEAARMAGVPLIVDCVSGPAAATDYLDDVAQLVNHQTYGDPALVLLDCHFPDAGSPNLVRWIRKHPWFNSLPVVIFTGSDAPEQIARCYSTGADHFLVKPTCRVLSRLTTIVQALHEYIASNPSSCELLMRLAEYRPHPRHPLRTAFSASLFPWIHGASPPPA